MKYTLDWLTNPEVFAVNRICCIKRLSFFCLTVHT